MKTFFVLFYSSFVASYSLSSMHLSSLRLLRIFHPENFSDAKGNCLDKNPSKDLHHNEGRTHTHTNTDPHCHSTTIS